MSRFNAYLKFTPRNGKTETYNMWVMSYTQPHQLGGSPSQSKWYQHFYPRSYSPGAISVRGRVPYQTDYDNMARFIRTHHELMVGSAGLSNLGTQSSQIPLMSMGILGEGLYVEGLIGSFQAGAKRWNIAPEFTFDFMVIKDAHSKNTDMVGAYAVRSMWSGSWIDEGPKKANIIDNTTKTTSTTTTTNGVTTTTNTTVTGP